MIKQQNVLIDTLSNDKEQRNESAKLTLTNIHKLTELCLSKCSFSYQNNLCFLYNRALFGFSFVGALSETYLQKTESKAKIETLNYKIAPKTFRHFENDSPSDFQERSHVHKFFRNTE